MNSRDRVQKVLEHEIPDRVPIDFGGMRSSGIATIAYNKLREKLGISNGLVKMYDFIQQLAYPEEEIMKLFNIDVINAGQAFLKERGDWDEWFLNDGSKCLIPSYLNIETTSDSTVLLKDNKNFILGKKPKSSLYVDQSYWVYQNLPKLPEKFNNEDLVKFVWAIPSPPDHLNIFDDAEFKIFISGIKDLYDNTDYSILLPVGCNLFEWGTWIRGLENFLVDVYIDKKGVQRLLDHLVELHLRKLERIIEGVGEYIDVLNFGDDLGGQDRPFMSPDIYTEVFKSRHKKMWDFVHEKSNCKVFIHSCGSIYELLPALIDAGLDVLNPVQTTCRDMEPERLKKEFGNNLIFWGGCCNTRDVLAKGTPKDVKEDVKKRMGILGENGGLVFNQIHNVLADVPPENVIAMLEAANEFGFYGK